jgi:hypothetical protein
VTAGRIALARPRVDWRAKSLDGIEQSAPLLIAAAVVAGLGFVGAATPIAGRGDFGQWLMASRYYLGLDVPAYRSIAALPPLVPVLLAAVQLAIPDRVVALQAFTAGMLVAVAVSFHAVGSVLLRSRVGGLLSLIAAFLITDRFVELLAFGGLFQLAAVAFINAAIAAFVRAGDGDRRSRWFWALGSLAMVLLALTHVGTATVGIPIALAVAGISILRLRRLRWVALIKLVAPLLVVLVAIGVYAVLVLAPASKDYVSNPASLAYRGPGRLMAGLLSYGPTAVVLVAGASVAVAGGAVDAMKRSLGGGSVLFAWTAGAWGFLLVASLAGTGTDYPRFAPIVLAPLVVCTAAALLVLTQALVRNARALTGSARVQLLGVLAPGVLAIVAIPFATVRYQAQMSSYQPIDGGSLTAATEFVDESLGSAPGAVLTSVRDGKWLEGLTGREALFNLPVRFAVRPDEWQRSVDADTILRSSMALANQFYFLKLSEPASNGDASAPTTTTISMNHGGEFVDVLQLRRGDTSLMGAYGTLTAQLGPVGSDAWQTAQQASYRTRWAQRSGARTAAFSRTVTLLNDGSTMSVIDSAPRYRIESVLRPAGGMAFTSVSIDGRSARICVAKVGEQEPCLQVWASEPDALLRSTSQGLEVQTTTSTQLSLYITDLTASGASVGLGLIDPAAVIARHDVKAAILLAADPAFDDRRARLEALGLQLVRQIGPYAIFQGAATP